jgi:peptidoglycan/xylan/chitin deacetylase (PgdA/CDA1 family)
VIGESMTLPRERVKYSAIVDRPNIELPPGARMVVWTIVNLEVWDISRPMPRQVLPAPSGSQVLPDVPHWAWHEYGMRVGFWRFLELYERLGIRPTVALNARVCVDYARVAQACKDARWEFMAHSFQQGPIHNENDQPAMIERTLSTIEQFTGKRPVGWLGPGLTETYDTPDYLAAAGVKYIGDWVYDEEPTEIATKHGPLVTLPYSIELNDITLMIVQHHEAAYWVQKCTDAFDRLYQESQKRSKIMAIAIHPYISGQPFRIKYLEAVYSHMAKCPGVLHWNGEQILDWYLKSKSSRS